MLQSSSLFTKQTISENKQLRSISLKISFFYNNANLSLDIPFLSK